MSIDAFGIHFGPLYLRFYGMILVGGAFVAGYLASLEARRRGHNPDYVWDGIIWALVGGIAGARLWHIFTPPPSMIQQGYTTVYYLSHPLEVLAVWNGGLGMPGAVAGGVLGIYLFTRSAKLNFVEWLDLAAPAIPLGQAIGRWGNFVNQELYGAPTSLPWGLTIDALHRVPGFEDPALRFHPLFLYESLGNLAICLTLLYIARRYADSLKRGDLFILYLVLYPALRFLLEFIRLDSARLLGLNANQTLMAITILLAGGLFSMRRRRPRRHQARAQAAE